MWDKIKTIIVTVLATLGVLFIILMIIPDDENETIETSGSGAQVVQQSEDVQDSYEAPGVQEDADVQEIPDAQEVPDVQEVAETEESSQSQEDTEDLSEADQNTGTVAVYIPESEISEKKLKFTTKTLDGKKVDQNIFSDYDITLVHVWGTYCRPCIAEMDKYASFYETIPENVNLVGIICDVYDGIDNNVDYANEILSDAGAGFMNLRTSDSVYDMTEEIQIIPSSFFVDREGHIIGQIMMGRNVDATLSRLNEYIRE